MAMAALLISILLCFFFFFVDGVFEATAGMAGDGAAMEGDGVIVDAGVVVVVRGVAVDTTEGGRARCRDDDETGSNDTVAVGRDRNVFAPRWIFFMGECAPFPGVAWRIAALLPGSATSA